MSEAAPESVDMKAPSALGHNIAGRFDKFRILEGDDLVPYLASMDPKEVGESIASAAAAAATASAAATELTEGAGAGAEVIPGALPPATGDAMETD